MMIYDDLTILMYSNIIKHNSYPLPSKSVTTAPKIGTSSPIPDRMMIYDDLTILMYSNIIKNNSYPLPSKSVTTAPKIGTSSPIPDTMMIYDDLTIVMYRNIIKNNSNPLPPKASPLHPKLAHHLPYQLEWWNMMIWTYWCIETPSKTTVNHCLKKCHHCTQNWDVISHTG